MTPAGKPSDDLARGTLNSIFEQLDSQGAGLCVKSVLLTAALVLVGLLALKALVVALEPRMAFYPLRGLDSTPRQLGIPYREIALETADGETVYAWLLSDQKPRAEVVFWHGNGGNLSVWLDVIARMRSESLTVLALDYRGYGKSTGRPTEEGLYRDTEALVRRFWEDVHEPGTKVLYWGRSLGVVPAAYATTLRKPDGLVLEAAFPDKRSLLGHYPSLLVLAPFSRYRFPTVEFLRGFDRPVLLVHGDRDGVIPIEQGRKTFERLEGDKRFVEIPGADHDDLHAHDPGAYWRALDRFIDEVRAR